MFKALQLKLPTECKQEKLSSIVQNAKYLDSRRHKKNLVRYRVTNKEKLS